jgi:hypothetical protein
MADLPSVTSFINSSAFPTTPKLRKQVWSVSYF